MFIIRKDQLQQLLKILFDDVFGFEKKIDYASVMVQVLEFIREGKSVAELMDLGKHMLGK